MRIEMQFLGTSAGMPSRLRGVTGLLLRLVPQRELVLVDCGEGSQQQILRSFGSLARLGTILITHMHGDHVLGLPGLLASRSLLGVVTPLRIAGPVGLRRFLEQTLAATYCRLNFPVEICEWQEPGMELHLGAYRVRPVPMVHDVPCFGYLFLQTDLRPRLDLEKIAAQGLRPGPLYGALQRQETITLPDGRPAVGESFLLPPSPPLRLFVGGDNKAPASLLPHVEQADVLVHEGTFLQADYDSMGKKQLHATVEEVLQAAEQAQVRNLVLTHFSPRYHSQQGQELIAAVVQSHAVKGRVFLANDLDTFQLRVPGGDLERV